MLKCNLTRYLIKSLQFNSRHILSSSFPETNFRKETIGELIISYCTKYSNRIALIDESRNISYTYTDVKNSINSIASSFTKKGVQKGTVVAIIASNSPEYLMLIYALPSIGCSVTVCNFNHTTKEIAAQLLDSNPSIIFTSSDCLQKVTEASSHLSNIKEIYVIGDRISGYDSVEDLLTDSGNMSPIGQLKLDLDSDIALLPYSSGTMGLPKGVMLTHSNIVSIYTQAEITLSDVDKHTMMMVLPFYHIFGIVAIAARSFSFGYPAVILPKFDPIKFLTIIEKYKVSLVHLVPPLILFLINHPMVAKFDLSSLREIVCGGAPLSAQSENQIVEKLQMKQPDFKLIQGYGLTETSGISHVVPADTGRKKSGSIGKLLANVQCKVVDITTREEVFANETGEILLKGPNMMKGYFNKLAETENTFENGWFKTGDIGHYDEDDYFYISDRLKELIKVKGHQVAPAELEAALLSFPGIIDCAVVGIPDERYGEVPKAFIVKNKDIEETEIHDFINSHLSPYKQIKGGIVFIDEIPKSPSGKILRRLLK